MLSLHQEKIYSYFFQMSRLLFFMNESVSAEFFLNKTVLGSCECMCVYNRGKNHLSWSPGQVKFQAGQSYIFTQCPAGK